MTERIQHKRGDTLSLDLEVTQDNAALDLTGYTITSQVRAKNGTLVADLTVAVTDAVQGELTVSSEETQEWPLGPLPWDVEFNSGSTRWSSATVIIEVLEDVTRSNG